MQEEIGKHDYIEINNPELPRDYFYATVSFNSLILSFSFFSFSTLS
ncbi:MAG: hypothetical protein ACD_2C00016G0016 [uncultured bacterium (gcode 4)]|uniref:Uncharacterized protein n=1 Tax=uncultured bacterium (gcode 4) TaxID=1234023 RepID=K2H336_9BACT|nr:MAG: hypothetical protein ACD_2C00016G0016 [uncultured bacterium (gcode 4)]